MTRLEHPVGSRSVAARSRPAPGTYDRLPPGLDPVFVGILDVALPFLQTRSNDSHARISTQFVVEFLEAEGGAPELALPAMILHDVGWHVIPEDEQRRAFGPGSSDAKLNRLHETSGVAIARDLLLSIDYPGALIDEICRIIDGHDSRPEPTSLEETIVKDADKIWRVSRLGFPLSLEMLVDLSPQELHDFIAVRVPVWFFTATARQMAAAELAERRKEYGLDPAPDIPPPAGFGIGDAAEYAL
ncbi:MAG: HD domain-containing protein [Actinobacteria bacterium]|nr:HD domain-containing protein [Actinomycetota bacterium]